MTEVDKYAVSAEWEAHKDYKAPFDYTLEDIFEDGQLIRKRSQTLLVHRVEMPDLLKHGLAAELDFMTKEIMAGDGKPQKEIIGNAISKAESFSKMEAMVNSVCLAGIIRPKIHPIPPVDGDGNAQPRQKGLFYVDQIPWDDRQELFGVIFDSEGLSDFREEQASDVGDVADVQDVQLPTDGPVEHSENSSEGVLSQ